MNLSLFTSAALPLLLAACGQTGGPGAVPVGHAAAALSNDAQSDIPANLVPPAGQELKLRVTGVGVQIYTCTATTVGGATTYAWVFKAPEADLLNEDGRFVGNHFLGPTWQYHDGSKVVGKVLAKDTVDPTAIPWLLLHAQSTGGPGRLADVTYIQRIHTSGGLSPTTGCDATTVGTDDRVPYSANYLFFHPQGAESDSAGDDHSR